MKIPKQAKKVFDGVIFDVYQWEQELFDGSKATFERIKRPYTVRTIATVGEEIIILEDEQPDRDMILALPGGRIDEGEDPLIAAQRELMEETGYTSDAWELFSETQPLNKMDWTMYTYIARNCKKTGEPTLDAGERIALKTVSFDAFIDIVSSEDFRAQDLSLKILRMKAEGTVTEIRKKLFSN